MDAEAYPEDAENVLNILWEIGSSMQMPHDSQWAKARISAIVALGQYEVSIGFQSLVRLLLGVFQAIFGSKLLISTLVSNYDPFFFRYHLWKKSFLTSTRIVHICSSRRQMRKF